VTIFTPFVTIAFVTWTIFLKSLHGHHPQHRAQERLVVLRHEYHHPSFEQNSHHSERRQSHSNNHHFMDPQQEESHPVDHYNTGRLSMDRHSSGHHRMDQYRVGYHSMGRHSAERHPVERYSAGCNSMEPRSAVPKSTCFYCDRRFRPGKQKVTFVLGSNFLVSGVRNLTEDNLEVVWP